MADLMGELDSNPEMQKEFERMMAELVQAGQAPTDAEAIEHIGRATEAVHLSPDDVAAATGASASSSSKKGGAAQPESFQDTVRKTMERMQASGASADAAAASDAPSSEEDMMAQLMKELQAGGGGGEEDFNKMLMGMMSQLTNKEILYEPMKELHDKFPTWMEENRSSTGKEDLARYEEQHAMVKQIVERFERKGYSDDNDDDREYIVERMQKVSNGSLVVTKDSANRNTADASRRLATARSSRRHERRTGSSGRT
jgi:peroxin-19